MTRFHCVTFGCRVNQYETQAIREQLLALGYQEAAVPQQAEVVVVNSCTVTAASDRECLNAVRVIHEKNPRTQIVVTGCLVQRDSDLLREMPGVRLLVGVNQKHRIAEWLRDLPQGWDSPPQVELELDQVYAPLTISSFSNYHKAFVKVQDGCSRACAFCKIPYVRGRARSRPLEEVVREVRRLVEKGYAEITLTGVAIGLWGKEETGMGELGRLLEAVDRLPGRFRVRLSSLDPRDLNEGLLAALAASSKVCRHLHLSLQSGSDAVLQRMNRGYTSGGYADRVRAVRRFWPDLGLTTDWIVGFPGEVESRFQESVEFCRRMRFARVHIFPFSRRRGTSAWAFRDAVPPAVVRTRAQALRQAAAQTAIEFQRSLLGSVQEVLLEQETHAGWSGYIGPFVRVFLEGPRPKDLIGGRLSPVEITGCAAEGLRGKFPSCTP